MRADQIRDIEWRDCADKQYAIFWMLQEIAAQLAEIDASLVAFNNTRSEYK